MKNSIKRVNINRSAFTLIELIVVITIIVVITTSWVFYFLDFVKTQGIKQKLIIIEDNIKKLDKKVKNYEIFDYNLKFNTSSTWSKLYITSINSFDTISQTLEIINSSWSWEIKVISATWTWTIKIYKNNKMFLYEEKDWLSDTYFNFNSSKNYKIESIHSWEILNEISLDYFSEENIYPDNNNFLELVEINTKKDKSWNNYSSITITNIWWNKNIWNNENEIFLFFENNWIESFIKIDK